MRTLAQGSEPCSRTLISHQGLKTAQMAITWRPADPPPSKGVLGAWSSRSGE